jgi:pentatricopeptide repeat protein
VRSWLNHPFFITVISSLAKNGHVQRAEEILRRMESYHKDGHTELGPNTITYNTLIDAYAKARDPVKAEEVLRRMMVVSQTRDDVKAG